MAYGGDVGWLRRLFPRAIVPIATARIGRHVRLRGRVIPRDLIMSPLSGELCVYYRYVVETWRTGAAQMVPGVRSGFWVLEDRDEAIAEFYLDDGSGRAVIAPEGAVVHGMAPFQLDLGNERRAMETRFTVGNLIEAVGVLEEADDLLDEARDYRAGAGVRILRSTPGEPLRLRALPP
jgi:hypothetical protein